MFSFQLILLAGVCFTTYPHTRLCPLPPSRLSEPLICLSLGGSVWPRDKGWGLVVGCWGWGAVIASLSFSQAEDLLRISLQWVWIVRNLFKWFNIDEFGISLKIVLFILICFTLISDLCVLQFYITTPFVRKIVRYEVSILCRVTQSWVSRLFKSLCYAIY